MWGGTIDIFLFNKLKQMKTLQVTLAVTPELSAS